MKKPKPKKLNGVYYFEVRTRYGFPLDMLRYDHAFVNPDDIEKDEIGRWEVKESKKRVITVAIPKWRGYNNSPTYGRWESFGTKVTRELALQDLWDRGEERITNDWVTWTSESNGEFKTFGVWSQEGER